MRRDWTLRGALLAGLTVQLATGLLVPAAHAATYTLRLDPATTEVRFLLDAFLHKVHGTARLERGEIRFDGDGAASGEVVIDATSAETGNEKRDRDMHGKVLESELFPEIVLVVDGFEGRFDPASPSVVTATARLRLHGGEHALRLETRLTPVGTGEARRIEATVSFVVPYVEWGMKDPSKAFLRVGKVVEVTIEARGALTEGDS